VGLLDVPVARDFENGNGGRPADPVFVLCVGRSGSTLPRLLLDTHPDLAWPPETNIPLATLLGIPTPTETPAFAGAQVPVLAEGR
jgi:hypothetical protein